MPVHGTYSNYIKGCRLDCCRDAARIYWKNNPKIKLPAGHGTRLDYSRGCKCALCRGANAKYRRDLRKIHHMLGIIKPREILKPRRECINCGVWFWVPRIKSTNDFSKRKTCSNGCVAELKSWNRIQKIKAAPEEHKFISSIGGKIGGKVTASIMARSGGRYNVRKTG